jgi:hypothetical protein
MYEMDLEFVMTAGAVAFLCFVAFGLIEHYLGGDDDGR